MEPDGGGAVAAAVAVARAHGGRPEQPVVLRDAWHVLVHLRPLPLVARVSTTVPFPEGPKPDDLVRELSVARHAARRGAPVIAPADELDPGPHRYGDRVVTFWRYELPVGETDPRQAGRGLRVIHEALADYEGPLPSAGHPEELEAMASSLGSTADAELLREAARRPPGDGQALHGDAHLDNCFASANGLRWHDFESACRGPREYDLAALVLRDRSRGGDTAARTALAAYGAHDADLVDALVPVYAAWVYASLLVALPRRPELASIVPRRLSWLRSWISRAGR